MLLSAAGMTGTWHVVAVRITHQEGIGSFQDSWEQIVAQKAPAGAPGLEGALPSCPAIRCQPEARECMHSWKLMYEIKATVLTWCQNTSCSHPVVAARINWFSGLAPCHGEMSSWQCAKMKSS
jgi:hypothetical protein